MHELHAGHARSHDDEMRRQLLRGVRLARRENALAAAFHDKHRQTYGHANPGEPVQLINLRLTALGRLPRLELRQDAAASRPARQRRVWFAETGFVDCGVHWRDGLATDTSLAGPAIIEAFDATIVVPPGWTAAVDARGYIRMHRTGLMLPATRDMTV